MPKNTISKPGTPKMRPRKSPAKQKALQAKRDAWVRQIDPAHLFHRLFDLIPNIYFFAKNRQGELMFSNQATQRDIHHCDRPEDELGRDEFDLYPAALAKSYIQDDARIYATGEALVNHVELNFNALGLPAWFVVNKMPIRSRTGKIIGIMGFGQTYEGRAKMLPPSDEISKAVAHIRQNYAQNIHLHELSRVAGLSGRQLERRIRSHFGVTPQQFLIKTRLVAACDQLLKTDRGLADIAMACGFTDQSAFGRTFRQYLGLTPTQFRRSRKMQ
jgi:AraC-like DNA-binding protein